MEYISKKVAAYGEFVLVCYSVANISLALSFFLFFSLLTSRKLRLTLDSPSSL